MISKIRKDNKGLVTIPIGQINVPLKIIFEKRNTVRVALGKDKAILRAPFYTKASLHEHIKMAHEWLLKIDAEQPDLIARFNFKYYDEENQILILGRDAYTIKMVEMETETGSIKLVGDTLSLEIPKNLNEHTKRNMVRDLLSKILIKRYKNVVSERIKLWNQHFFNKEIKGISLKYNTSNWGSCSASNRLNISSRCLLLPLDVFDYIIVHELSHLIEMNHSKAFWDVVKAVMPNYEEKEEWLKKNGSQLEF